MRLIARVFPLLVAAFLAVTGSAQAADRQPDALALLERARQLEDLKSSDNSPYDLKSQVVIQFDKHRAQGQYDLNWESAIRWREELNIGDYNRLRVGVEGGYHQSPAFDHQPARIIEFERVLNFLWLLKARPDDSVGRIHDRRINGTVLSCVEIRAKDTAQRTVCMDPTGSFVYADVAFNSSLKEGEHEIFTFSRFASPLGKPFPFQMELSVGKTFKIEISVLIFEKTVQSDPTLFAEPQHSEFWEGCTDVEPAKILERINPSYPPEARQAWQEGIVTLYAIIERDGSVSHIQIVQSPYPSLTRAAQEAVSQWKYKPPICHGSPMRAETTIDMIFSLRH